MKILPMLRIIAISLLFPGMMLTAQEPQSAELTAPVGWGGETIKLPPGFAADMKWTGVEHIRFAPGMMKPPSDSFFCYAFVFDLDRQPELSEAVIKDEFLKYYRGLCKAVLRGQRPDVDLSKFTLELKRIESTTKTSAYEQDSDIGRPGQYSGTLTWVEPFATKQAQTLNLEIWSWTRAERNYLFACVSPQSRDSAIWQQLRAIRDDYLKKQAAEPAAP
jgi:hypothetical protein